MTSASSVGQTPVNVKVNEAAIPDLDDMKPVVVKRGAEAATDTVANPSKASAPVTAEAKAHAATVLSDLRQTTLARVQRRIGAGEVTQKDFDEKKAWVLGLDQFQMRQIGRDDEKLLAAQATKMLDGVRAAECGEAGQMLIKVDQQMNGFSMEIVDKASGLFSYFKDKKEVAEAAFKQWRQQGETINKILDKMCDDIEKKEIDMEREIGELQISFEAGRTALGNLEFSVAVASVAWVELNDKIIPELRARQAADLSDQSITIALNDAVARAHALDIQIGELGKSLTDVGTHMPTVRLMQQTNADLISGMENVRIRTMARWRRVFATAKILHTQKTNAEGLQAVAKRDAALAEQQAKVLKGNATAARQIIEDGVTSYDSLELAQKAVIETVTEVLEIQKRATAARVEAENRMLKGTEAMSERLRTVGT